MISLASKDGVQARHALQRRRPRVPSQLMECVLGLSSLTALLMITLIFLFVGREAMPVALGQVNSALVQDVRPVEEALRLPPEELTKYLGLTSREFEVLDTAALRELAALKVETQANIAESFRRDPDARSNTTSWRFLLLPHSWTGYPRPVYIWQPISLIRKYNLVPLVVGSLKVTAVGLAVALPLALSAALYVAQLASSRWRSLLKPAIELLAAVPSVVIGFLALVVLASLLKAPIQGIAGLLGIAASRLNACVAGVALGVAVIPTVFSVAEEALAAVPRRYTQAALALGATRWQAAWQVALPSALPGVFAAGVLGFGRAISETMIVLMASGNAPIMSWNIFVPARTMTATIAAELAEAVFGGHHYRLLFLIGTLLFVITFLSNLLADLVIHRFRQRLEGRP